MLIGLTGAAFAGKDSVGEHLRTGHGFHSKAFADPLRDGLKVMFNLRDEHFQPSAKEVAIDWIGKSPRELMQTLGTEWGREQVCRQLWVTHMARRIENPLRSGMNIVITDVRYVSEAELIHRYGGEIWRIVRPAGPKTGHGEHTSEKEDRRIIADYDLVNESTLDSLYEQVDDTLDGRDERAYSWLKAVPGRLSR